MAPTCRSGPWLRETCDCGAFLYSARDGEHASECLYCQREELRLTLEAVENLRAVKARKLA